ncbi:unnamed protein product [Adineta steineri]|uniref:Sodium/glucose cotransporter 4 n=1 Tax=Adineta steineri TaxID=433720 RepID=A0A814D8W3_9BILA|nr:unnamed protein product [Adineta steineri]CAF0949905.1 unnamed protein product [Adineta steineri]
MADTINSFSLHWADILVLIAYFAIVIGFGIWSSCKNRGSIGGYFLAGRTMTFLPVGASLFASNIGSGHFIGLAGSGVSNGIGVAGFELNASYVLIILGWIFLPVYIKADVFTMPEFLKKRFGGDRIRFYQTVLALILSIFTKISVDLYSGAIFLNQALGWNMYVSVIALVALAALFTIGGGLSAVIWTDFIQTIIMIIAACILMVISYVRVGGLQLIKEFYPYSVADTTLFNETFCGIPPEDYFSVIRPLNSDNGPPWVGIIGMTILSIWYWCSDQVIVQRAPAAKNLTHARAGCIVASYLKFLPLFLMIIPGMAARILFPDRIACSNPETCKQICGNEASCTDIAYPLIVIELMPNGLRGLMLACMIAALMTSLTSIFNSSSTIFTIDIWQRFRTNAPQWELLIVGRIFTLILVVISILWIPIISIAQGGRLFDYIQAVQSFLAPPICAIYLLAILWKRINEESAFWGLICGLIIGLIRFIWEFSYVVPSCELLHTDQRPAAIKFHFLYFAILLFVLTYLITITISLLTRPIPEQCLYGLNIFDLNNPLKPTPIPTKIGYWHKADTSFEDKNIPRTSTVIQPTNESGRRFTIFYPDPSNKNAKYYFKVICSWICGVEKSKDGNNQANALITMPPLAAENVFWKRICNINGIFILAFCAFLWAFFTDYRIDKLYKSF